MPTPRILPLLLLLPLACTTSPGTTTHASTTGSTTEDHATHGEHTTHDEPTTHAEHTTGTTGHHHDSEAETHHDDTAAATGEPSPLAAYCECMLEKCHDLYHATWGEDHEASEAMCLAAAAMAPITGMPATMGNSLECRQHYCDLGEAEPGACDSALGGGVCVD